MMLRDSRRLLVDRKWRVVTYTVPEIRMEPSPKFTIGRPISAPAGSIFDSWFSYSIEPVVKNWLATQYFLIIF